MKMAIDTTKRKELLSEDISKTRETALQSGFNYLGEKYPCDETFQAIINSYLLSYSLNIRDEKQTVMIRQINNSYVYMSYKDLIDFAKALFEHTDKLWSQSWEAKDNLTK